VGGADTDLIASGCLLDIKVSKPGRPKPHELWQLAGYALLDWEDEYALHSLAIYFARHGLTAQWELEELLSLLAGTTVSVAQMRKDFRAFLTDLVGEVPAVSAVLWGFAVLALDPLVHAASQRSVLCRGSRDVARASS